jgi:hypothetical protein
MPSSKKLKEKEEKVDDVEEQDGGAKKKAKKTKKSKKQKGGASKKQASKKVKRTGDRYFKVIDEKSGKTFGRYTGETPKQAASKSFTKLLQKMKESGKGAPKNVKIFLRESTRGSNRKVYGYTASRVKLSEPQELKIVDKETGDEKTITYNYRNKIHKIAVPDQIGGAKKKPKKSGSKTSKPKSKGSKGKGKKPAAKKSTTKKPAAKKSKGKKSKGKGSKSKKN